jgi:hypothetical protein
MKGITVLIAVVFCLSAPLAAQRGKGLGQVRVGAGAGVGAGVGVPNVRVDTGPHARAGVGVRADQSIAARAHTMERARPRQVLTENTHLSTRLQTMLPAGQSVESASAGFKNTGQFVAAVHAANNLNIPFDQIKARMTGSEKLSLGKSIQQLRPDVNAKSEEKRAKRQAQAELEASARAAMSAGAARRGRK